MFRKFGSRTSNRIRRTRPRAPFWQIHCENCKCGNLNRCQTSPKISAEMCPHIDYKNPRPPEHNVKCVCILFLIYAQTPGTQCQMHVHITYEMSGSPEPNARCMCILFLLLFVVVVCITGSLSRRAVFVITRRSTR